MLRRSRLTIAASLFAPFAVPAAVPAATGVTTSLIKPGDPLKVRPAGTSQLHRMRTTTGKFVRLTIDQHDLDTSVSIESPSKGTLASADEFEFGRDSVSFVAAVDEIVQIRIKVLARHASDATYTITADLPREFGESERRLLAAEWMSTALKDLSRSAANNDLPLLIEEGRRVTAAWGAAGIWEAEIASVVEIGDLLLAHGEVANARDEYLRALSLAAAHAGTPVAAAAANDAGYCELQLGALRESEAHLKQALQAWTSLKSKYGQMAALNNLGMWQRRTGDYGGARRAYQDALKLVYWQDRQTRGLLFNNIGLMHLSLGAYAHAIEDLGQAFDLLSNTDSSARSKALMNLGRAHLMQGHPAQAIRLCERALALAPAPDQRARADIFNNLGQAYAALRNSAQAQHYLENARDLYRKVEDRRGEASVAHHRGLIAAVGSPGTELEFAL